MNYTRIILHVSSSLNLALICNLLNSLLHLLINIWLILLPHLCSLLFKMFLLLELLFQIESEPMNQIQSLQPPSKTQHLGKTQRGPKKSSQCNKLFREDETQRSRKLKTGTVKMGWHLKMN